MKYTYMPTFPAPLDPTVTIHSQGNGSSGTGGTWGSMSGKTLNVTVPSSATPGDTYQVTLRATTTDPTQILDIKILFTIAESASASGSQSNIVLGTAVDFTPTVSGMGTFTWAVTSGKTLPAGLSVNASTGKITGTPTNLGEQVVYLTATSSYGEPTDLVVTFNVVPQLTITNEPSSGAIIYVIS